MCCESESRIRITSSRSGAGVDILTLTPSHVGLGAPRKVLTAVLEGQKLSSIHIHFRRFRKSMTQSWNTDRFCNTAAKICVLLKMNDANAPWYYSTLSWSIIIEKWVVVLGHILIGVSSHVVFIFDLYWQLLVLEQLLSMCMSRSPLWLCRVNSVVLMHVYNTNRKSYWEPLIHWLLM